MKDLTILECYHYLHKTIGFNMPNWFIIATISIILLFSLLIGISISFKTLFPILKIMINSIKDKCNVHKANKYYYNNDKYNLVVFLSETQLKCSNAKEIMAFAKALNNSNYWSNEKSFQDGKEMNIYNKNEYYFNLHLDKLFYNKNTMGLKLLSEPLTYKPFSNRDLFIN